MLPNRVSEAAFTIVGKVIYSGIGTKTGPYFSLPEAQYMLDITPDEMKKVKVGFAICFINRDLVVDTMLSDELNDHNQAVLEFFLTVQEHADKRLESCAVGCAKPVVNQKPFLKLEDGNLCFALPVSSDRVYPQFGARRVQASRVPDFNKFRFWALGVSTKQCRPQGVFR
jgi:hypothetical protein